jgi:hypothetical protein
MRLAFTTSLNQTRRRVGIVKTRYLTATVATMALAGLIWTQPGTAQQASQPLTQQPRQEQRASDMNQMMEDRIFLQLAERAWAGKDFKISVDGHTATVTGTVPNEAAKARVLRAVRLTPGVFDVKDQLQVSRASAASMTGTPIPDKELAKRVAQQIAH